VCVCACVCVLDGDMKVSGCLLVAVLTALCLSSDYLTGCNDLH